MKPLDAPKLEQLKAYCSADVYEMVHYCRAVFLLRVGESENVEALDKAELRVQILKAAEEQLRANLVKFALNFEVQSLQNQLTSIE